MDIKDINCIQKSKTIAFDNIFEADEIALFSATALSYETGYAKPHMQAYRIIANRLGCAESECVFIDDQPSFVEAAEKSGMHAILFRGSEQLKLELQKLLHVADSDK